MAKDINCLVHHNADRTAEREGGDQAYEYLWEVQQVRRDCPSAKRAGTSPVNAVVREMVMEKQVHFQSSD